LVIQGAAFLLPKIGSEAEVLKALKESKVGAGM